jgi:hypothetical protein
MALEELDDVLEAIEEIEAPDNRLYVSEAFRSFRCLCFLSYAYLVAGKISSTS